MGNARRSFQLMKALLRLLLAFPLAVQGQTILEKDGLASFSVDVDAAALVQNWRQLTPALNNESNHHLLWRYLEQNNVKMLPPASVWLEEKKGRVLVHVALDERKRVEDLIRMAGADLEKSFKIPSTWASDGLRTRCIQVIPNYDGPGSFGESLRRATFPKKDESTR